ncbi:GNAT family N-acetyltransferase [Luteimonas saliphila]|uniref:GNAT family N-acetyltransferase n=1 Tax=Luteimonas saliphila TaxID=2804919 RepID=UPI00192E012F|nr:GNAT family N-acetyltransferase [Luteimonas saliphila]
MDATTIEHVPGSAFHAHVAGDRGVLEYGLSAGRMEIAHTFVPAALRGRGIAGQLVRAALDHARAEGLAVVPACPYAAGWIERHPVYADLVADR